MNSVAFKPLVILLRNRLRSLNYGVIEHYFFTPVP